MPQAINVTLPPIQPHERAATVDYDVCVTVEMFHMLTADIHEIDYMMPIGVALDAARSRWPQVDESDASPSRYTRLVHCWLTRILLADSSNATIRDCRRASGTQTTPAIHPLVVGWLQRSWARTRRDTLYRNNTAPGWLHFIGDSVTGSMRKDLLEVPFATRPTLMNVSLRDNCNSVGCMVHCACHDEPAEEMLPHVRIHVRRISIGLITLPKLSWTFPAQNRFQRCVSAWQKHSEPLRERMPALPVMKATRLFAHGPTHVYYLAGSHNPQVADDVTSRRRFERGYARWLGMQRSDASVVLALQTANDPTVEPRKYRRLDGTCMLSNARVHARNRASLEAFWRSRCLSARRELSRCRVLDLFTPSLALLFDTHFYSPGDPVHYTGRCNEHGTSSRRPQGCRFAMHALREVLMSLPTDTQSVLSAEEGERGQSVGNSSVSSHVGNTALASDKVHTCYRRASAPASAAK